MGNIYQLYEIANGTFLTVFIGLAIFVIIMEKLAIRKCDDGDGDKNLDSMMKHGAIILIAFGLRIIFNIVDYGWAAEIIFIALLHDYLTKVHDLAIKLEMGWLVKVLEFVKIAKEKV